MNHYERLKVSRDAPDTVIRAAYKALMQKYHPDKYDGDPANAEQLSKQLQQAYETLIDPQRRLKYDQQLGKSEHGQAHAPRTNRRSKSFFRYGIAVGIALSALYIAWEPPGFNLKQTPQPGPEASPPSGQNISPPLPQASRPSSKSPAQTRYWDQEAAPIDLASVRQSNGPCINGSHAEYYENGDVFLSCFGHRTDGKTVLDVLLQTADHHYLSAGRCENGIYRYYAEQDCQQGIFKAQKGKQTLYSDQQNASADASLAIGARLPKYWSNRRAVGQPVTVEECKRLFAQAPHYAMGPCRF